MHGTAMLGGVCGLIALLGCSQASPEREARQPLEGRLAPDVCSLDGDFSLNATNPYFPIEVGLQSTLEGSEDDVSILLRITVLDEVERVGGIGTRVIEEREWADGELVEVSRNFFAEAGDGTVCYFGEDVAIYEPGGRVSNAGSWRADAPGNAPGIMMPASPKPGMKFQIERAPGVAEDEGKLIGIGPITVEAGTFVDTIRIREYNPLDGDKGYKIFAAGVGLVIDDTLELVSY